MALHLGFSVQVGMVMVFSCHHLVRKLRRHSIRQLVLLLPFHPPVLEPDFDLPLAQAERMCDFDSSLSCEIAVEVELLFQLQCLIPGIRVIRFLNAEGIQTSQICQRMKNIYGESCLSQKKKTFINGLKSSKIDEKRKKKKGKLSKGVLFFHDNARSHTSCKTVSTIIKLGFEVLEHPAYSPDLAPSDYFLFGLLKKELKGKRFDSDEDVQKVVQDFFTRFLRVPIKRVFTSCQNDGDDV
ncbi:hypothetical protein LAZ67_11001703 [Cordylochernes scorpioides]|uniref:Histone-lysine N-methyltransferase SETMAR n=1 Tax=Cordylochernes scorpioides TaxID=51811 RepID=A0ABY6KZC2_9ARAC|nr:hypothetical protein LAZ67_11001703 [Cordylochernes scorpioides]